MGIDVQALTFKRDTHYNGKEWFGHGWTCVQYPALTLIRRYWRKNRQVTEAWRFDGTEYADAASAIAALESTL